MCGRWDSNDGFFSRLAAFFVAGPLTTRSGRWWGSGLVLLVFLAHGCGVKVDHRYATPAATFKTYQEAIRARDLDALWECYSSGYQEHISGGRARWEETWRAKPEGAWRAELARQIKEERVIDSDIAYLLFEPSTVSGPGAMHFFYFVREGKAWRLTSHLDGVFHQRLERALEDGALQLPSP